MYFQIRDLRKGQKRTWTRRGIIFDYRYRFLVVQNNFCSQIQIWASLEFFLTDTDLDFSGINSVMISIRMVFPRLATQRRNCFLIHGCVHFDVYHAALSECGLLNGVCGAGYVSGKCVFLFGYLLSVVAALLSLFLLSHRVHSRITLSSVSRDTAHWQSAVQPETRVS